MAQLLDVADNLERAIASAKEAGDGGGDSSHDVLLQGVEMTSQEVRAAAAPATPGQGDLYDSMPISASHSRPPFHLSIPPAPLPSLPLPQSSLDSKGDYIRWLDCGYGMRDLVAYA